MITRRRALGLAALGGLTGLLAACGSGGDAASGTTTTASATTATAAEVPEETAGPYPADGSNGVDVLGQRGIVRSDITGASAPGRRSRRGCRSRSR